METFNDRLELNHHAAWGCVIIQGVDRVVKLSEYPVEHKKVVEKLSKKGFLPLFSARTTILSTGRSVAAAFSLQTGNLHLNIVLAYKCSLWKPFFLLRLPVLGRITRACGIRFRFCLRSSTHE